MDIDFYAQSEAQMPHYDFISIAGKWCSDQSAILLNLVWLAYDKMIKDKPYIDTRDLERSITQLLEPRIHQVMSGDEPYYVMHGPYERESMKDSPAQPPQYDLAFILHGNEQIMWPLEAKVLETSGTVADYVADIKDQFLVCRYAPFTSEGAMIGYLLSGSPADTFDNISKKVPCQLIGHPFFATRPQRQSSHTRTVPSGKSYPANFCCHHLMLEFTGVGRCPKKS